MKEKILQKMTFKKPYQKIDPQYHPELKHIIPDCELIDAFIKEVGVVERDDGIYEYQDLRVYLKVKE